MTQILDRPRIAVLLAAHNRCALTLRALRAVTSQRDFNSTVILFDDASTDHTAQIVEANFPEVIVIHGDGNAFWNGGMYQAWSYARTVGFDGYLWLNDDVKLDTDALARLYGEWETRGGTNKPFVLVGATRDQSGVLTYGGQNRIFSPFSLRFVKQGISEDVRTVDTFNGNVVLVSNATVDRIGINDPNFFHVLGDLDYGLRATTAGIPVLLMPGTMGVCDQNQPVPMNRGSWLERWTRVNSHRGLPFRSWWRMTRRWSGVWAISHFLLAYRRLLLPDQSQ